MEPWANKKEEGSYPLSTIVGKYDTVLKSIINHKPTQHQGDLFSFLIELVEYFGIDNTILITRKNFEDHLLSFSNLMYGQYKFKEHFKKTGIKNFQLKQNNSRRWKVSDLPESYLNNKKLQQEYRSILTERRNLLFKLSSHFRKKVVWYEDLYGKDRKLSLNIIKSWKFDIDCNLLNQQLNPEFKYMVKEELRLL